MNIRTGIFGGTFNPIHIGHLALANYLCEFTSLDELWFMVSPQNPLKGESSFLTDKQRLNLVETAIKGYARFHVSDFEFSLPRPSYTIHTIDELKKAYPDREFILIMGADNWQLVNRWKDSGRLIQENEIWVYPRPGYHIDESTFPATAKFIDAPLLDISSTFIRKAIEERKDIRYLLHPEVYKQLTTYF